MHLLIVDGSNIAMRCALGGDIAPTEAVSTATSMIERAVLFCEATHLVITLDSPGVASWRKVVYPAYKANRARDTSPWIHAAAESWVRRWWCEDVLGYEADDINSARSPSSALRSSS